ncbi:MAG: sensor histidine kinase [Clostridia bacterium]|nr:sensor histidine kinase [Clostridia bacterium]
MPRRFTLQRLFNMLAVLIVATVLLVYVIFRVFSLNPAYEEGEREANNIVVTCRDNIQNQLRTMSNIANSLTYNTEFQAYVTETRPYNLYERTEYIRSLVSLVCENNSSIKSVIVVDANNQYRTLYGNGTGVNIGRTPAVEECEPNRFIFMQSVSDNRFDMCGYCKNIIATSGNDYGEVLGRLYIVMDMYNIQLLLDGIDMGDDGFVAVADENGKILMSNSDNVGITVDYADSNYQSSSMLPTDFRMVTTSHIQNSYINGIQLVSRFTMMMLGVLLFIILGIYYLFMRRFIRPVAKITEAMNKNITLHERIAVSTGSELDIIVDGVNSMLDRMEDLTKRIVSNQRKLYELELLNQQSSILALQNQVNPHFLFNTLECIRSISLVYNCKEISTITVSLSKIYRYSAQGNPRVTFGEEMNIIKEYMNIINIRFPDKIEIRYNIEQKLMDKPCYKMILQPIVENAVKHGIEKKAGRGLLEVTSYCKGDDIYIVISDNGCGMSPEKLAEVRSNLVSEDTENIHIGLNNVNKRLQLHYGSNYGLAIDSTLGEGTKVTVKIPDIK